MTCTVSERIAGPCNSCGERAEPGHIVTDQRGPAIPSVNLYCAECCPAETDLSGADLSRADLTPIRDDFWAVLCSAPKEVPALRAALVEGRIDGSTYSGECACLVGTIAKARDCNEFQIPGLAPNAHRPAERFFLSIDPGDTPDNSQFAKLAVEWIDDFTARMTAAFSQTK